ncbi:STAS/SEC14 domain-containing protein [Chitinilyticum litopenaei]|uniref:STAS/SEC14 domain-containing protein n=1 Tax=Chitinilyticum litopenaei TaxID=1121276 RepID=UPI0003F812BC|nr:STAS/SEC14 domain-containing protein [Chitinilyticum litopenaei]
MISISHEPGYIHAKVFGEFTVQDFRQFEEEALYELRFQDKADMLIDLNDMLAYTIDMAVEELRFVTRHRQQFKRVAIVSSDQWVTWSVWVNRVISESEIRVFEDVEEAQRWLATSP